MRRADRLFQIVQFLRGGRLITAAILAERLEVSERTIYRDIADLQSSGVPIDGEAGVGYIMRSGFDLPPLMFTRDEIVSLVVGARMVRAWGGVSMARAAEEALVKIKAVIPDAEQSRVSDTKIFAPPMAMSDRSREILDQAEHAVEHHLVLSFGYCDEKRAKTERCVHPLGLWFWGKVWTLVSWCEMRNDFRMFRLDRMNELRTTTRKFKPTSERSLAEFLRQIETRDKKRCEFPPE